MHDVGSPSLSVSVIEKIAVDDICGADLQRANAEYVKKINNCLDIK